MSFAEIISQTLGTLYRLEFVKKLKSWIRPVKHAVFGKTGIYLAIENVARLSGGADKIRTVFDIGAANGEYALHFLRAFPDATVYCFEPFPGSFEKLMERTAPYKDRVRLFKFGLHNREETLPFYVGDHPDASSLVDKKIGFANKINIRVRRLDDVVREEKIPEIDFLKIDVEGNEREVLEGGAETIKSKVKTAFIEIQPQFKGFHSRDHLAVFKTLADADFGWGGCYHDDYFFSKFLPR